MDFDLTREEKLSLLAIARESIASKLENRESHSVEATGTMLAECGAFVTLHIGQRLRGCIGSMTGSRALHEAIHDLARSSAFADPRFPPLSARELSDVDIEISVLSPMWRIKDVNEIQVGRHGLYMAKGYRSGVLLPQVATEQGWDRETFLTHCCYKADLPGEAWQQPDIEISVFTAIIFGEKPQQQA